MTNDFTVQEEELAQWLKETWLTEWIDNEHITQDAWLLTAKTLRKKLKEEYTKGLDAGYEIAQNSVTNTAQLLQDVFQLEPLNTTGWEDKDVDEIIEDIKIAVNFLKSKFCHSAACRHDTKLHPEFICICDYEKIITKIDEAFKIVQT